MITSNQKEYGDWQTNMDLALNVCRLLKDKGINPKVIIEPTCGKGHFILAALQVFNCVEDIYGIEIYKPYLDELNAQLPYYHNQKVCVHLFHQNIFDFNFNDIIQSIGGRDILILGNPPWVTNSKLGEIGSNNLPSKKNFKSLSGIDAITGKGNFDIAESICRKMIDSFRGKNAHLALLLKNSVIRNIVYGQRKSPLPINDIEQYSIDTKKEFDVSVAASLFCCEYGDVSSTYCIVKDFYTHNTIQIYGWASDCFVSDIDSYHRYAYLDGQSPLKWWSGIKHDCTKVMELSYDGEKYVNGLGEIVDIESEMVYPLVKSSDIKNKMITSTRKYVIVTQHSPSDDTQWIKSKHPKSYQYLLNHAEYLDKRSSRIYQGRARFCMFGVGSYSFKPYKIAVSGLYKQPTFAIIPPIAGKSAMLDDTCYMLGVNTLEEAIITQDILNSVPVQSFIKSLLFSDAKRVINKELLMRIDLIKAAEYIAKNRIGNAKMQRYDAMLKANIIPKQLSIF